MGRLAARRGKKGNATRATLLDAALKVIAKKGYTAATVDEIVKVAGVSKGLAYYHFKNKADLASAVLMKGLDTLLERFESIAQESTCASEALTCMLDAFADQVVEQREFGRFFFAELWREGRVWSDDMRVYEERLVEIIAKQFVRGQGEGTISANADAVFAAVSSIGLVLSTSLYYFGPNTLDEPIDKGEFAKRVSTFVRRATSATATHRNDRVLP